MNRLNNLPVFYYPYIIPVSPFSCLCKKKFKCNTVKLFSIMKVFLPSFPQCPAWLNLQSQDSVFLSSQFYTMFMSVSYELRNLNILRSLQSEADHWVVFATLAAILSMQNIAVNPKVSTVCTGPGSKRGMGQFIPVVSVNTLQVNLQSVGRVILLLGNLKGYCQEF